MVPVFRETLWVDEIRREPGISFLAVRRVHRTANSAGPVPLTASW